LHLLSRFAAACRFLTILPLPGRLGQDEQALAGSLPFFPLVGLLVGGVATAAAWLLWLVFPPLVAGALLTVFLLKVSGGLHLDGLADTVDGFFSARPDRTTILAIMRDSRIGAMGVMGLVMVLLLKALSLGSLDRGHAMAAALLVPLAGRTAIVLTMAVLPYARQEGGLGTLFYSGRSRWSALAGLALFALVAMAILGRRGIVLLAAVLVMLVIFALFCRTKIGGATGDTLGAACELAETITALVMSCRIGS